MKFADSLKFNIVPEWRDNYLDYDSLKDEIYSLDEKVLNEKLTVKDAEEAFMKQLNKQVEHVVNFYNEKSEEIFKTYNELSDELKKRFNIIIVPERSSTNADSSTEDSNVEIDHYDPEKQENEKGGNLERIVSNQTVLTQNSMVKDSSLMTNIDDKIFEAEGLKISSKKAITTAFISLSELKSFIELNKVGFSKITKKFDKTLSVATRESFLNWLEQNTDIFDPQTVASINEKINNLFHSYSLLTNQTIEEVKNDFKIYLREQIIMERSVVWKDLLSLENNNFKVTKQKLGHKSKYWEFHPFNKTVKIPKMLVQKDCIKLYIAIIITFVLLFVKTLNDRVQGRCLALLACCAYLWATETIPLFVTALLVPFLTVLFKVLKDDDGNIKGGQAASQYILSTMFSSVIMLLLGGFTLAAALSKYNIAKFLSSYLLYASGTNPRRVLLACMGIAMFLSMWISNVAAPVLCYSLIQPVLRSIPTESPIAAALVLGIALASNAGGMASPIASPQNIVAIESMDPNPGWGKWFAVAIPVCFFELIFIWLLLIFTFNFKGQRLKAVKPIKEKFNLTQWFICFVTIGTIILWCILTKVENVFGEAGIISCIPMVLYFGTGILNTSDLNAYPWNIIILAQGGLALGKAVTSSGLLKTVALSLKDRIETWSIFEVLLIFGLLIIVFATFVSHTVAALIIIPLVKEVGESLPKPRPLVLVMGTSLLASGAMALPTSGFPNVTAVGLVDEKGVRYVKHNTFVSRGIPASIICFISIISVGYGIMSAIGF